MKKGLLASILLLSLFLTNGLYPIDSLRVDALLIGYGGDRMLPFIDGAELTFFVGEELELKTIGSSANITIIDPLYRRYEYFLEEGKKMKVLTFNASDVGTWLLRHSKLGTMSLKVIDNYSPKDHYISIQKISDDVLRLSLEGSAFIGFLAKSKNVTKIMNPSKNLHITIPSGTTHVRITLEYNEPIELSGLIGDVQYHYKTDAVVSEYTNRFSKPIAEPIVINFEIPEVGKVGSGGIIPLRVGPIRLKVVCTGTGSTILNYVDELLIIPEEVNLQSITRTIDVELTELINDNIKIAYYNVSTGRIDVINVKVPVYRLIVYDKALSKNIDDYSFDVLEMLSLKSDHITYIVPTRLQLLNDTHNNYAIINSKIEVYSVDISNMIKNITLKKEDLNTIIIESKEIEITVKHVDGTLIKNALILVNSSKHSIINGSARIRMPIAIYNFSAVTSIGYASSIIDISKKDNVQLIIKTLTSTTMALIIISAFQTALFSHYILKLIKLKRTIKNKLTHI
ncbi:MAG: hypothetical protein QW737_00110 [Nitrososphaerota archaeon]